MRRNIKAHIWVASILLILSFLSLLHVLFSSASGKPFGLIVWPGVVSVFLIVLLSAVLIHFFRLSAKMLSDKQVTSEIKAYKTAKNSKEVLDKVDSLISIIENIESNEPFKNILTFIYNSFTEYIPYSHIGVSLIDNECQTIRAAYAVSGPQHPHLAKRLAGYQTELKSTSLMQVLSSGMPRVINDLENYLKGRKINEYNKILLEEGIRSSIAFPLVKNHTPIGIIFFSSGQKNIYRMEHIEFLGTLANSIMLSLEKNLLLDEMVVSSTLALATLADERDNETGEHLYRMKRYSTLLAELLMREGTFLGRIDTDFINSLERFSPLHDIGKVAISDSILLKPGKLTAAEFDIMKTHTTYGGKVLRLADENVMKKGRSIFGMGIEITEGHHERWDGTGYPYNKSGDSIPLSARIVAVADVFDALTSKRPYKNAMDFEISAEIIIGESGTHFDPRIINVFRRNLNSFKSVYDGFNKSM